MKKLLIVAAIASTLLFAGCKKTCHCTTTQVVPDEAPFITETTLTIEKGKCSDMNTTQTSSFDGETVTQTIECVQE